jgi:hypothetical protein
MKKSEFGEVGYFGDATSPASTSPCLERGRQKTLKAHNLISIAHPHISCKNVSELLLDDLSVTVCLLDIFFSLAFYQVLLKC